MSYRPEKLEILPMEDEQAVMVNLYRVTNSLLAGRITEKLAGLTLWSIAIGAPSAGRVRKAHHGGTETRRKSKRVLPRMHADERGSEKQQLANGNSQLAKPKTSETQRNRGKGGKAGHSGVTNDKSFVSGVNAGSTPTDRRDFRHRATSAPSGQNQAIRGARHRGIGKAKPNTFETQSQRSKQRIAKGRAELLRVSVPQ